MADEPRRGAEAGEAGTQGSSGAANVADIYPLTPVQQGLLMTILLAEDRRRFYSDQIVFALRGRLDAAAWHAAWQEVVERQPALRTQLAWERRARPLQVVRRAVELPWQELDWRGLPESVREGRLADFLRDDHARGFALDRAPLLRGALIRWEEGSARFVLTFHHILLDGWSLARVLAEVRAAYAARLASRPVELPPAVPFRGYVAWIERRAAADAEAFWRRELAGLPAPAPLPFDGEGEALDAEEGGWATAAETAVLPAAVAERLTALARRLRVTPSTLFQGAWALLLDRASAHPPGAGDVVFGGVVAGRPPELPGVEEMVGLFINALPVRVAIDPARDLAGWLAELQARQVELRRFEHSALEEIAAWAGAPRERPLFESLVVFQNFPELPRTIGAGVGEEGGLAIEIAIGREATHYPLALYVKAGGAGASLGLVFHRRRFAATAARRLLDMLGNLLAGMAARPEARLGELPLLTAAERREVLLGAAGPAPAEAPATALRRFEERAARQPHAVAVEHGEAALTYGELDRLAGQLAGHMAGRLRDLGAAPDEVVGLCLDRSLAAIVGILGIWKAGAGYLPLDPLHPAERLAFLVADAGARLVLTTPALAGRLPAAATAVFLDGSGESASGTVTDGPAMGPCDPRSLAYVIYTSGSTSTPKGVMVDHAALAGFVAAAAEMHGVAPGDRVLQFASLAFDASAEEIYPCLACGATLILRDAGMTGSFQGFLAEAARLATTVLDLPTAYWRQLAAELEPPDAALPAALRLAIIGGEEAAAAPLAAWRAAARRAPGGRSPRLVNTYGPTEATVVATARDLTEDLPRAVAAAAGGRVPIGRAIAGARAHVLDAEIAPLPPGLDGELWLGGSGLSRGYLRRPELTADRFRPDPFGGAGERLYRTGDLGRLLPGGEILFRGRADGQVKVRGIRVELGEVEAALRRLSGVRDAAAILAPGGAGGGRLVAFLVASAAPLEPPAALRAALAARLPEAMIPSAFVAVESLPRTPGGKVDRAALARSPLPREAGEGGEPPAGARTSAPRAPLTPLQELVAGIWGELLQVERIGLDDDFFSLGGHSLLVAQVLSRLRHALGVEVPLVEFFRHPTVAGLAELVERAERGALAADLPPLPPIEPAPRDGTPLPVSYAQERVWFLDQLLPGGNLAYNFQVATWLWGPLRPEVLARVLSEIVRRHEVLRTSFPTRDGQPVQVVHEAAPLRLPMIDLGGLPAALRRPAAEELIEALIRIPFELAKGPLIRWRLLRLDAAEHLLAQVEHHFVHDGWSLAILLREVKALYEAFLAGEPSPLPEPPVQYADFAAWQRRWMEGPVMERLLAFWRERLAGSPPSLELPTDRPWPPQGSFRGGFLLPRIEPELYQALRAFGRREGFTLYMTMLAGFLALLGRYTGEEDVVIGTANANRRAREVEGMLGMMVNTLVLRADLSGRPAWRAHLGRVRELALAVYAHQDMPFERLVRELKLPRRPGRNPLFQILFNFHDAPIPDLRVADLDTFPEVRSNHTAKMAMNVIVVPRAEQRVGRAGDDQDRRALLHWEYNSDLFDAATVLRMAGHYQVLLAGALADPGRALAELPLLSAAERTELLASWNDTGRELPREGSIPARFAAWAARTPAATAVVYDDESLAYAEVEARANRLAHHLQALGAGPGELVGLAMERSLDLVPAILGILASGAAYLPLDPSYPEERLAFMLADGGVRLLVADDALLPRLPAAGLEIVSLPRDREAITRRPATAPAPPGGEDLAYVMYTSGSTGRPKGVAVTHRNVLRLAEGGFARLGPEETILQLAPISFDASTFELWGALLHGGRLAIFPPGSPTPAALGAAIARHGATAMWLTAALFHEVVDADPGALAPLSQLLTGGEVISPAHARRALAALPGLTLIAGYGPTEGTTFTACHVMARPEDVGATVPLGRPIANTRAYVVDPELQPLPIGVPGELVAGGDGLALGYLGLPDLTAERFVPDPFAGTAGGRLYRTGDRARWRPGGILEFLGRIDRQVKIRGFRIEPGEVEAALAAHPEVAGAAVLALPAPGAAPSSGTAELRLVAYLVPAEGAPGAAEPDAWLAALRQHLAARLPAYMVPAAWVLLAALPRTANGKVDRAALSREEPAAPRRGAEEAPRTPMERAVAAIWREVLGVGAAGAGDDFFLLGGHSLAALRVLARLRQELGVELAIGDLFERPVLADLAAAVEAAGPAGEDADRIAPAGYEELSDGELDALLGDLAEEGTA